MRRLMLMAVMFLSGCVLQTEPADCVYAEKLNPYGYVGEPIRMCVCPSGASIPVECR